MSWLRTNAIGPRAANLPTLPPLARVGAVLDDRQRQAWQTAARAIERAGLARKAQAEAVALIDAGRCQDEDEARAAARADKASGGRRHERQAREAVDRAKLDAEAAASVAVERVVELANAVIGDQRGIAEHAVARLAELVEAGADWRDVLDAVELAVWARDVDEQVELRQHPRRAELTAAEATIRDVPGELADEAIARLDWLLKPAAPAQVEAEGDQAAPAPVVGTLVTR